LDKKKNPIKSVIKPKAANKKRQKLVTRLTLKISSYNHANFHCENQNDLVDWYERTSEVHVGKDCLAAIDQSLRQKQLAIRVDEILQIARQNDTSSIAYMCFCKEKSVAINGLDRLLARTNIVESPQQVEMRKFAACAA